MEDKKIMELKGNIHCRIWLSVWMCHPCPLIMKRWVLSALCMHILLSTSDLIKCTITVTVLFCKKCMPSHKLCKHGYILTNVSSPTLSNCANTLNAIHILQKMCSTNTPLERMLTHVYIPVAIEQWHFSWLNTTALALLWGTSLGKMLCQNSIYNYWLSYVRLL